MRIKRSHFLLACVALLFLPACETAYEDIEEKGQYWQRVSASDAAFQQGPKAQQMLNRDIGRCVVELRELERLGSLKNAIPTDNSGRVLDPDADQAKLDAWDTPERDKYLFAEHTDFHDFETCMLANGWERIKYVPYDVAERARQTYLQAHIDYQYQSRFERKNESEKRRRGNYDHLNE